MSKEIVNPKYKVGDVVYTVGDDPQKLLMCTVLGAEYFYMPDEQRFGDDWFYSLKGYNLGKTELLCRYESDLVYLPMSDEDNKEEL